MSKDESTAPARDALPAAREPGWYWVRLTPGGSQMPACLVHNDKPDRTLIHWLDAWLENELEPVEIGPRIPSPSSPPAPDDLRALSARLAELSAKATQDDLRFEGTQIVERERPHMRLFFLPSDYHENPACKPNARLVVALWNAFRAGHLHAGPARDEGWRPMTAMPEWPDVPFRQLIAVEGRFHQLDTDVHWCRVHVGEATAHQFGPLGYREADIERLRIDGNMDVVERVLWWMPLSALPPLPEPPSALRRPPQPSEGGE